VTCGEVEVQPGDLILGAEDGVLAIPQGHIDDVVREAYEKSRTESRVRVALRNGCRRGRRIAVRRD